MVECALRTGEEPQDEGLSNPYVAALMATLSRGTMSSLRKEFPRLYHRGKFDREQLLRYLNEEERGSRNHDTYGSILNRQAVPVYLAWLARSGPNTVLSSGVLIERGNLTLVDRAILIHIPEEKQLEHLCSREQGRGRPLSESEARKALGRQYPFERRLELARAQLGESAVRVVGYDSPCALVHDGKSV